MIFNPEFFLDLIYTMSERGHMTNKALAKAIGKEEKTLGRELNPHDHGAKLGVVDFAYATAESGDFMPLDYMESALGRVAFDLPTLRGEPKEITCQVAITVREFGELLHEVSKSLADNTLKPLEAHRCLMELADVVRALAGLRAILKQHLQPMGARAGRVLADRTASPPC